MKILDHTVSKSFLACLLFSFVLAALNFAFFVRTLDYQTISYDDRRLTYELEEAYNSKGIIKTIFTNAVFLNSKHAYYRPILPFSFFLDNMLGNGRTSMHISHLTNVMLHIACVLLLFIFCLKYCFGAFESFLIALIFSVSSFSAYSVAWLAGRNDLLLFLFTFLSFICFIACNENSGYKKTALFLLHFVFFFLAFLSKETAVIIPAACMVFGCLKKYKFDFKALIIWVCITAIFFFLRKNTGIGGSVFKYLFTPFVLKDNLYMIADFFSNAFMLSRDEIFPYIIKTPVLIAGYLAIVITAIAGRFSKNKKEALFFLGLALVFLLPNFLINRVHFQGNRMYMPFAFLIISVFYIVLSFARTSKQKAVLTAAAFIFITMSALRTNARMGVFYDDVSFFGNAVAQTPSAASLFALGEAFVRRGDYEKAAVKFEEIEMTGQSWQGLAINLASVNIHLGKYEKAGQIYEKYSHLFAHDKDYYEMLIFCYSKSGNLGKAGEYEARLKELDLAAEKK
ncbi:MAG: hypothetical protein LBQ47_05890 [Endomicrobium sp.]|jgi:hypothetical protein|nr:hypothetical protein [Endomicrobium sp.]